MSPVTRHTICPLIPGPPATIEVEHREVPAVEYDLYIPAGIWTHRAVQAFLADPIALEGGATISKGATGIWHGGQEETHVIRIVIRSDRPHHDEHDGYFAHLQQRVGDLMAELAQSPETCQHEVMFTAKPIRLSISRIIAEERS